METTELSISVLDLVTPIAEVVDIMSPVIGRHHLQVAYLSFRLAEDRPYRGGMDKAEAISTLQSRVDDGELDGEIVNLVIENYDHLDEIRDSAQELATREYSEFQELLRKSSL